MLRWPATDRPHFYPKIIRCFADFIDSIAYTRIMYWSFRGIILFIIVSSAHSCVGLYQQSVHEKISANVWSIVWNRRLMWDYRTIQNNMGANKKKMLSWASFIVFTCMCAAHKYQSAGHVHIVFHQNDNLILLWMDGTMRITLDHRKVSHVYLSIHVSSFALVGFATNTTITYRVLGQPFCRMNIK